MYPKKIYFIRHGETEYNRLNIVQGRGVDAELNAVGHWQAAAFHNAYRDVPFEAVIASTLQRTHQTVAGFLDSQGIPFTTLADLDEMHWGRFEGQPSSPELREIYRQVTQEWSSGNYSFAFADGENALQLAERISRALTHLFNRPEQTLLVCSHGRALRCLLCLAQGISISEMGNIHPKNTGLFLAHFDGSKCTFELENDTQHFALYPEPKPKLS